MSLTQVEKTDRSSASFQLPVNLLLSAPMMPTWREARAGAGRHR